MRKKIFVVLTILLTSVSLFALRVENSAEHDYDSDVLIRKFYKEEPLSSYLEDYWDSVQIGLITLSKGPDLYSWFGHTALVVDFPDYTSYMFDYGRFMFDKEFYENFLKGDLWYWCGCSYSAYLIGKCEQEERNMTYVPLDLSSEQKRAVVDFLEQNIKDENCTYSYNPYSDNCATRVRDIINVVTDGDFEKWAKAQPGYTYRDHASRILYVSPVLQWFIDAIQGRNADFSVTRWEESFLPEKLEQAVIDYAKLGNEKSFIVDNRETDKSTPNALEPTYRYGVYIVVSVILALASVLLFKYKKIWASYTFIINFVLAICGCVIAFFMFFTNHWEAWNNENLLFMNPLLFVLAILSFKRDKHLKVLEIGYFVFAEITLLLIIAKIILPNFFIQKNICQILVVLPFYISNWFMILRLEQSRLNSVQGSSTEQSNPLK